MTVPEELGPGDLLPWGVVRDKAWGGPIGIDAWRVVVTGHHRPLWLEPRRGVICRRAFERADVAQVVGVVSSDPAHAGDQRIRARQYILRHARRRSKLRPGSTCR